MEDSYQYFNSRGNTVRLPLSTDSSGQSCVYWTDIEDCFPGVLRIQDGLTFVPVVRGADGYRLKPHRIKHYLQTLTVVYYNRSSVSAERERQRQSPSSSQPPAPSTRKKISDRQKTKATSFEEVSTSASPPTAIASTPVSSPLAAAIAAMSESSFMIDATVAWSPRFSGVSSASTNGTTVRPISFGLKTSSILQATKASRTLCIKVPVQGLDPSGTTSTMIPTTTTRPGPGDIESALAVSEETTTSESPDISPTNRTIKMLLSPARRLNKCRFKPVEEGPPPGIQEHISKDARDDELDTTMIPSLTIANDNQTTMLDPPSFQEPVSIGAFNTQGSIDTFPRRTLDSNTQEVSNSPFSRVFSLFQ